VVLTPYQRIPARVSFADLLSRDNGAPLSRLLSTDFQPSASVVAVVVVFLVLVTPVPVRPPLLVRGAVPLGIRLTFIGPIRTPVALLTGVPVVIVSVLLIVVPMAFTVVSIAIISIVVISILYGTRSCKRHGNWCYKRHTKRNRSSELSCSIHNLSCPIDTGLRSRCFYEGPQSGTDLLDVERTSHSVTTERCSFLSGSEAACR
jgi:hypothetical protein